MSAAAEVQTLLRLLSQDARVPLSTALSKINDLRKAKLNTPEAISRSSAIADLGPIFSGDEKLARQVLAAAKRVSNPKSKKRSATGDGAAGSSPIAKRARGAPSGERHEQLTPAAAEVSVAFPQSTLSVDDLQSISVQTNRAPLLLAFAVTLLKYTMPEQPLSSRLSLAQAVVSANSRTKAQSIGLVAGKSAEDEGWGQGQPRVKVMGRMIPVMRRSGYGPDTSTSGNAGHANVNVKTEGQSPESQASMQGDKDGDVVPKENKEQTSNEKETKELPLWGLDLEALRKINNHKTGQGGRTIQASTASDRLHLPIHTPQSAQAYLLKSFTILSPQQPTKAAPTNSSKQNSPAALSHLLLALNLLFSSWAMNGDDSIDLDSKAWGWYVHLRPEVEPGERGWGQKGRVDLGAILKLRK